AGGAFIVTGTATGPLTSNTTNAAGNCAAFTLRDTTMTTASGTTTVKANRDWRLVGRIPMAQQLDTEGNLAPVTHCNVLDVDATANRHIQGNGTFNNMTVSEVPDDNTVAPPTSDAKVPPNLWSEARMIPVRTLATNLPDNPCQFIGGPTPSDDVAGHRH